MQSSMRTHRQGLSQLLVALGAADRNDDDLAAVLLVESNRFFDRNFVERIDLIFQPGRFNAVPGSVDLYLGVRVRNAFNGH
jgi:hypothetical protein